MSREIRQSETLLLKLNYNACDVVMCLRLHLIQLQLPSNNSNTVVSS